MSTFPIDKSNLGPRPDGRQILGGNKLSEKQPSVPVQATGRFSQALNPLGIIFREGTDSFSTMLDRNKGIQGKPLNPSKHYKVIKISGRQAEVVTERSRFVSWRKQHVDFESANINMTKADYVYILLDDASVEQEGPAKELAPQPRPDLSARISTAKARSGFHTMTDTFNDAIRRSDGEGNLAGVKKDTNPVSYQVVQVQDKPSQVDFMVNETIDLNTTQGVERITGLLPGTEFVIVGKERWGTLVFQSAIKTGATRVDFKFTKDDMKPSVLDLPWETTIKITALPEVLDLTKQDDIEKLSALPHGTEFYFIVNGVNDSTPFTLDSVTYDREHGFGRLKSHTEDQPFNDSLPYKNTKIILVKPKSDIPPSGTKSVLSKMMASRPGGSDTSLQTESSSMPADEETDLKSLKSGAAIKLQNGKMYSEQFTSDVTNFLHGKRMLVSQGNVRDQECICTGFGINADRYFSSMFIEEKRPFYLSNGDITLKVTG